MGDFDQVLHTSSIDTSSAAQEPRASIALSNVAYFPFTWKPLAKLWQRQVSVIVPHDGCRDHLGMLTYSARGYQQAFCENVDLKPYLLSPLLALERTFLGYLRTSLALSVLSVIIAQLFRLQHSQNPNRVFGYFTLGIPLACVCIGVAILILLLGAYRFWRQQNAILRGKVLAGGWELNAIGLTIFMV